MACHRRGDPVVVYPERADAYHEEYDEETTGTSGHPDDGWHTYDIKRYHIPDPDGQEIGYIELIGEGSSYRVTLSITRAKPFNRAYNAYWTCVSASFEEVQQLLQQEEAARRQAAFPKDTPRIQPPTVPAALPRVAAEAADQRREFQVTFYGTPAEFGAIVAFFVQRQAHRYGGELFQVRLPLTPDAPLVQIWVYDLAITRGCVGSIVALTADQQPRARRIAASAVFVSVIYNTLAGLFHRRPDLLADLPLGLDVILAILHGLPLAIVAYSVAHLLLHDLPRPARGTEVGAAAARRPLPDMSDERPAADTAPPDARNALQPLVTGYSANQPCAAPQGITLGNAVPVAIRQHLDPLSEHTSIYDHTTLQPIAAGSTLLTHRCPRCGSPISQAQYAAAVRRGSTWRGCSQCRSAST